VQAHYPRNKAKTFLDIVRRIENWPTAVGMRLRRRATGDRLLAFRDGLTVICRGSLDWPAIHELLFAGCYDAGIHHLPGGQCKTVLDLGGNIGLFSLRAAQHLPEATVHAFEPGPPNYRLFEMNLLANPSLAARVHLHREAVGGEASTANWCIDANSPGGANLYDTSGKSFSVSVRSFESVVASIGGQIDFLKMDIEGAEYDLLRGTPPAVWEQVTSIALELHHDYTGRMTPEQFLQQMQEMGYSPHARWADTHFLHRR
jgi:FkbM family methyltransferase